MKQLYYVPFFVEDPLQELAYLKENLDFVLETAGMGTWDINLETGRILCSLEMLRMWEVTPSQIQGDRQILQSKVFPEDLLMMKKKIDEAILVRGIYEASYRIIPRAGITKWIYSKGRCRYLPGQEDPVSFFGIVQDITHLKITEPQLT